MKRWTVGFALLVVLVGVGQAQAGLKIYWTDSQAEGGSLDKVQRANLDGSDVEDLVVSTESRHFDGLVVSPTQGKVYWTDYWPPECRIWRADLDGSNVEYSPLYWSVMHGIALDVPNNYLYYMRSAIFRADLDNPYPTGWSLVMRPGAPEFIDLALDTTHGEMYWTEASSLGSDPRGVIWRAGLDGSNVEQVLTTPGTPLGIALHLASDQMYWVEANYGVNGIWRADLNGNNREMILAVDCPWEIALDLDNGKIYYSNNDYSNQASISRADLNGSNVEMIVSGIGSVRGLALGPADYEGPPVPRWPSPEANVIPEPSTFIIWSLLGTLGIIVGWWRRRREAASA